MPSILPAGSTALQVLRQSTLPPPSAGGKPANAAPVLGAVRGGDNSIVARAKITEALFSVNSLDPTKVKANLFERLGKEFGLSVDDFDSVQGFGRASKQAVEQARLKPEGRAALAAIETRLGLGRLGLSIDALVEAMIDPGGDADEAVETALLGAAKDEQEKALAGLRSLALDGDGLYAR